MRSKRPVFSTLSGTYHRSCAILINIKPWPLGDFDQNCPIEYGDFYRGPAPIVPSHRRMPELA